MTEPEDNLPPWPDLIAEMGLIKRQASQVKSIYSFTVPGVAATEEQLAAAEGRLGHPLDPMHRAFLGYGNGWVDFYLNNSLLSTEEIGQGEAWQELTERLDAFYEEVEDLGVVPPRAEIYPISFDPHGSTIFAIWHGGPVFGGGHRVLWLPWPDTEPYDNFFRFFAAVYQIHQEVLTGDE